LFGLASSPHLVSKPSRRIPFEVGHAFLGPTKKKEEEEEEEEDGSDAVRKVRRKKFTNSSEAVVNICRIRTRSWDAREPDVECDAATGEFRLTGANGCALIRLPARHPTAAGPNRSRTLTLTSTSSCIFGRLSRRRSRLVVDMCRALGRGVVTRSVPNRARDSVPFCRSPLTRRTLSPTWTIASRPSSVSLSPPPPLLLPLLLLGS
jgi:hypothetical protein